MEATTRLRDCFQRAADAQAAASRPGEASVGCGEALLQLVATSREGGDDFRAALATSDGVGKVDTGRPLLEMLLLLAQRGSDEAQADALLETAARALAIAPTLGLPPREHDRLVQLALEVAAEVLQSSSSTSPSAQVRGIAAGNVCGLLQRPEEGADVLLTAIKVLASLLRDRASGRVELLMDPVSVLVRVLARTPHQRVELIQSACELLLSLADRSELVQVMVSDQLIRVLGSILRSSYESSEVVIAALQLLHRASRDVHAHGQIINEGLVPGLFQAIDRSFDSPLATSAACSVLAAVMEFADDCRLDLSPFLNAHCVGSVLIKAAAHGLDDAETSASVVKCLVCAASNPVDLPQLINSTAVEGLLGLFMGATTANTRAILAEGIRQVITLLPRAVIEEFDIKNDAATLPVLFLCLRNYREDLRLASQVFAIVTRHWKAHGQNAQSIAGYVEIAVNRIQRALTRESPSWMIEVVELCNFLREILLADNGSDILTCCGGGELLALLRVKLSSEIVPDPSTAQGTAAMVSAVLRIINILMELLGSLQSTAPAQSSGILFAEPEDLVTAAMPKVAIFKTKSSSQLPPNDRPGDGDYVEYVAFAVQSERGVYKPRRRVSHWPPDLSQVYSTPPPRADDGISANLSEPIGVKTTRVEEDGRPASSESSASIEVEETGEDASDASDADGDEENGDECAFKLSADDEAVLADSSNDAGLYEAGDEEDDAPVEATAVEATTATAGLDTACSPGRLHHHQMPDTLMAGSLTAFGLDPTQLEDGECCFIGRNGMRFPKHPTRPRRGQAAHSIGSAVHEEEDLVWSVPEYEEHCYRPEPEVAAQFVADATTRRVLFDTADAASRAQTVYKCASLHELLRRRAHSAAMHHHKLFQTTPNDRSSAQDEGEEDDSDPIDCPYHVPHTSRAFAASAHDSLTFDSMFESGNLARAIRVGESEYDLVLRPDLRTSGHMQWFYFAISNAQPLPDSVTSSGERSIDQRQYRFNIINLCKPDSLFNHGLQPVVYSVRDAREKNIGWRRGGRDVHYFPNQYLRKRVASGGSTASNGSSSSSAVAGSGACYFTLTFTLEFSQQDDTYLVAHSFPYTLHTHRLHISSLLPLIQCQDGYIDVDNRNNKPKERSLKATPRPILRRSELCKTLGGTSCELLTISEFSTDACNVKELESRRSVVITARVHPGEPQASWMMRGVIDFLVGDSDVARALRRMFVFYLIPILNPDGVYYGNNRCSLSACDLNRQWLSPSAEAHPTIFHAKQLIAREHAAQGVVFFCDLHGHSRKHNVFMYGCDTKKRPNPRARVFPRRLASRPKSFLSLPDCSFKVSKDKEATARVVLAYSLEIPWSFTLEASFCGTNLSPLSVEGGGIDSGVHFTTQHFYEIGAALCESIFLNCVSDGSVRERLCAMVDDRNADFARIAEPFVREAALATPRSGGSVHGKSKPNSKSVFNEAKADGRSKVKRTSGGSLRCISSDGSSSQTNGCGNGRRSSRTPTQPPQPSPRLVLPLRKSSSIVVPETVTPVVSTGIDSSHITAPLDLMAMNSPRARLSGKKIRIKKTKSSISHSGHGSQANTLHRSPREADCLSASHSFATEEARISIGLAASRQSATRIGPLWPSITTPGFSSEDAGTFTTVRTAPSMGGTPLPDLGFQLTRETPYVTLPASASPRAGVDPTTTDSALASLSPKPPAPRLRFRGAGRQYAAVSNGCQYQRQRSAVLDLLKADTTVVYTYDQNLLNASAMALRQRSAVSVASPGSTSPVNCRLNPLTLERSVTPPRTKAPATPVRHGL